MYRKIYKFFLLFIFSTLTAIACSSNTEPTQTETPNSQQQKPPNIVMLIADDMGYSDLSLYGGEVKTPNIETLAKEGMMWTHFYASTTCPPTRAMILSGVDNHLAGFGTMPGYVASSQEGKPGYETQLSQKIVTMPTLLKDAGYNTYMVGKWHLGKKEGWRPSERGFEQTFSLLDGAGDHYTKRGYLPTRRVSEYSSNGKPVDLPENFYSTNYYTDKLIEFIDSDRKDKKPFFAYVAHTSPHDPLQVPDEHYQKYKGKYDAGWDSIREQRFQRMKEIGLIPQDLELPPRWENVPAWESLTSEEQKYEAKTMAIYAGMIDNLDENIGRLIDHLKQIGEYENTIFVFISDNGPEGANRPERPAWQAWLQEEGVDNSYGNIGKPNSFVALNIGWTQVSSTPFLWFKGRVSEGGIRVPAIFAYPGVIPADSQSDAFGSVVDLMPTLLEYAGVEHPGNSYNGQEIYPLNGRSLEPVLSGESDRVYTEEDSIGFELFGFGNSALIQGDWKILRLIEPWGDGEWKLFNIRQDPRELTNLAQQEPERLQEMIRLYEQYEQEKGVVSTTEVLYE
ncbi:MAG: arylsulfatase [Cyanobacteria bacterium J06592_8]